MVDTVARNSDLCGGSDWGGDSGDGCPTDLPADRD